MSLTRLVAVRRPARRAMAAHPAAFAEDPTAAGVASSSGRQRRPGPAIRPALKEGTRQSEKALRRENAADASGDLMLPPWELRRTGCIRRAVTSESMRAPRR